MEVSVSSSWLMWCEHALKEIYLKMSQSSTPGTYSDTSMQTMPPVEQVTIFQNGQPCLQNGQLSYRNGQLSNKMEVRVSSSWLMWCEQELKEILLYLKMSQSSTPESYSDNCRQTMPLVKQARNFQNGQPPSFQNGQPPSFQNGQPPSFQNGQPSSFQNGQPPSFQNGQPPSFQNGQPLSFQNDQPSFQNDKPSYQNDQPYLYGDSSPKEINDDGKKDEDSDPMKMVVISNDDGTPDEEEDKEDNSLDEMEVALSESLETWVTEFRDEVMTLKEDQGESIVKKAELLLMDTVHYREKLDKLKAVKVKLEHLSSSLSNKTTNKQQDIYCQSIVSEKGPSPHRLQKRVLAGCSNPPTLEESTPLDVIPLKLLTGDGGGLVYKDLSYSKEEDMLLLPSDEEKQLMLLLQSEDEYIVSNDDSPITSQETPGRIITFSNDSSRLTLEDLVSCSSGTHKLQALLEGVYCELTGSYSELNPSNILFGRCLTCDKFDLLHNFPVDFQGVGYSCCFRRGLTEVLRVFNVIFKLSDPSSFSPVNIRVANQHIEELVGCSPAQWRRLDGLQRMKLVEALRGRIGQKIKLVVSVLKGGGGGGGQPELHVVQSEVLEEDALKRQS